MLTERITVRAKDAKKVGIGYVCGRKLTFHKIGTRKNGSRTGKCNICSDDDPKAIVYGVLYEIPNDQFSELNSYEKGYSITKLIVHSAAAGEIAAVAHDADSTDLTLIPYDWYHSLVLAGARQHNLPTFYIQDYIAHIPFEETDSTYKDAKEAKELLLRIQITETGPVCTLGR
jgi:hypothetical protein